MLARKRRQSGRGSVGASAPRRRGFAGLVAAVDLNAFQPLEPLERRDHMQRHRLLNFISRHGRFAQMIDLAAHRLDALDRAGLFVAVSVAAVTEIVVNDIERIARADHLDKRGSLDFNAGKKKPAIGWNHVAPAGEFRQGTPAPRTFCGAAPLEKRGSLDFNGGKTKPAIGWNHVARVGDLRQGTQSLRIFCAAVGRVNQLVPCVEMVIDVFQNENHFDDVAHFAAASARKGYPNRCMRVLWMIHASPVAASRAACSPPKYWVIFSTNPMASPFILH